MTDTPKNYLTPAGHRRLQDELYQLVHKERPEIVQVVNWAAGNGDRSENGDYLYGKRRMLANACVVDPETREATDQVFFAATVTLERGDGSEQVVRIVGEDEIDSAKGKISWKSPLARALIKARDGDIVRLNTPEGTETIEILAVEYTAID